MLVIMGYRISVRAQNAARDAIFARTRSFSAAQIGREIAELIRPSKQAWPGKTVEDAAAAVAEEIIWQEFKAGSLRPVQSWRYHQRQWRVVPVEKRNLR